MNSEQIVARISEYTQGLRALNQRLLEGEPSEALWLEAEKIAQESDDFLNTLEPLIAPMSEEAQLPIFRACGGLAYYVTSILHWRTPVEAV